MGDAQILGIPPGETRYAAFAADPKVGVETEQASTDTVETVTADRGVVTFTRKLRRATVYTVDGAVTAPRTVMIDHPRQIGWDLEADVKIESDTGSEARLRAQLKPGETATVTVTESILSGEELHLLDADYGTLVAWSNSMEVDPAIREAFSRLAGLRRALAEAERAVEDAGTDIARLVGEQDRVRSNLGAVPDTSDLAKTYLGRMGDLDEAIAGAEDTREEAEAAAVAARRAYEAAIADF
jgi:hypothetical protein